MHSDDKHHKLGVSHILYLPRRELVCHTMKLFEPDHDATELETE